MKKRFAKSFVTMLTLIAMLTQNAYGVYAAASSPAPIQVENEYAEETSDDIEVVTEETTEYDVNNEEGTEVEYVDGDLDVDYEEPTDDVNYDDQVMAIDEEVDTNLPEELEVLDSQISGSGLDSVEVFVNTDDLEMGDLFRIIFTGPDSARYDTRLNDNLDSTSGGTYRFLDLNKEGFNIRATSDDDVRFEYSSNDGTPVIKVISNVTDVEKKFTTKSITLGDGSPVIAIDGIGYNQVTLNLDTEKLSDKAEYSLYVDTAADITINGTSVVDGMLSGLDASESKFVIEGLDNEAFVIYIAGDNEVYVTSEIEIENEESGIALVTLEGEEPRTKADYEYEDANVRVTATLTDPKAVPDDAVFKVTQIVADNAVEAYIEALNNASDSEEDKYTEDNTLLYDIAFLVEKTDEEGNVIEGEYVEYEPEAGSVKIEITFKKSQISDELGATEGEEIEINHLPLVDAVKESVDTTVDANDAIDASDIIVEPVKADVDVEEGAEDTVAIELDSLSVVAVTSLNTDVSVAKVTDFDLTLSLGDAADYGVVSNYFEQKGHTETNCYTASYYGHTPDLGASANYSNAGGDIYIGSFAPGCCKNKIRFPQEPRFVYLGDDAWKEAYIGNDKSTKIATINDIDNNLFERTKCSTTEFVHVQKNVANTLSSIATYYSKYYSLKDAENKAPVFKTKTVDNGAKLGATSVDLTGQGAGLFVTNYNGGDLSTDGKGWMDLKLNADNQKLLINVTPTNSKEFNLNYFNLNGKSVNSYVGSTDKNDDALTEAVIFNFGSYSGKINITNMAAVIIAPNATVETKSTCGGIVVCDKFNSFGGEWHYHNHNLPAPGSYSFKATKYFANDRWPDNGTITLRLQALSNVRGDSCYDAETTMYGNSVTGKGPLPNGARDYIDIVVSKEHPVADFGSVVFPYNNNNTECYMYKIYEVNNHLPGVTYDPTVQRIKIWVNKLRDGNGNKKVAITVNGSITGTKCDGNITDIRFNNTYNPAKGKIILKKEIEGKGMSVGPYYFEVQQKNSPYKRLTQSEGIDENWNKPHTFALNAGETFEITNVPAGEYTVVEYRTEDGWKDPEENNGDDNTVPTSDKSLGYKVVYSDGQNVTITGNSQVTKVVKNISTLGSDKVQISGTKSVNPASYGMKANDYSFTIKRATATDNTGVTLPADNNAAPLPGVLTVNNDASGNFSFADIEYDADHINKTYYYVVYENSGNAFGMTYDGKKFLVKVEVTNENGKVKATKTISQIGGTLKEIKFTNNVEARGSVTFDAHKTLTGKTLEASKFTFKLERSENANGTSRTLLTDKAVNAANGSVDFKVKEDFTEANIGKTYYYFVTEIGPDTKTDGISYSKAEYRYTVKIEGIDKSKGLENNKFAELIISKKVDIKTANGWSAYTKNNSVPEFENRYDVSGNAVIKVRKNTGNEASSKKLSNTVFSFTVTQTDKDYKVLTKTENNKSVPVYSKSASVTGAGTVTFDGISFDKAGTYYFTVKEDLPSGVDATKKTLNGITYDVDPHYVELTVEDKDGNGVLTVTGQKNGADTVKVNTEVDINNTYSVFPTETDLIGTKTLSGKTLEKGQFEFAISALNDAPLPKVTSVKNSADAVNNIKFGPINYTSDGEYEYHITETSKSGSGIIVDTRTWKAVVTVTDTNGELSVSKKEYFIVGDTANTSYTGFKFENSYKTDDTTAVIEAQKTFKSNGIKTLKAGDFTFELCELDGTKYVPVENVPQVTNSETGKVTFAPIKYSFADKGEHVYYIHEVVKNEVTGYTYDEDYHPVYVNVKDNGEGKLSTEVKYGKEKADSLTITNSYKAEGDAVIPVAKKMTGRKLAEGEEVKFILTPVVADGYDTDDTNGVQYATITGTGRSNEGSTSFSLHYEKTGTFKYNVTEVPGNDTNVTYSNKVYEVIVTVSDAAGAGARTGYGKLAADVKVTNGPISFVNESTKVGSIELYAKKSLNNGTLREKDFTFTLTENGKLIDTVKNDKAGDVKFAAIDYAAKKGVDYSSPVTYEYIIKETDPEKKYVDYDKTEYKVVVTVSESTTSALNIEKKFYKKAEDETEFKEIQDGSCADFTFVNKYSASGYVQFAAKKELNGATLLDKEFTFDLFENSDLTKAIQTVQNEPKGLVQFKKITYNEKDLTGDSDGNGTYYKYYTIKEREGAAGNGYTYGGESYIVVVSLKDNHIGGIDTSYRIVDAKEQPKEQGKIIAWFTGLFNKNGVDAVFNNTYEANGRVSFSGKKILKGKKLETGDYSFTIEENGKVIRTASNVDDSVTFDDIYYTLADVGPHTYVITETNKNNTIAGVKYSNATYTAVVTVAEKTNESGQVIRDGKLDVSATVTKADTTEDENKVQFSITKGSATFDAKAADNTTVSKPVGTLAVGPLAFENSYNTKPAEATVVGKKTIDGLASNESITTYAGRFTFTMEDLKVTDVSGNEISYVKDYSDSQVNGNDGTYSFKDIEFTREDLKNADGTYDAARKFVYTVTESATAGADVKGIVFDASNPKEVTVLVSDNGAGKLTAEVLEKDSEGYAANAKFTNVKVAEGQLFVSVEKKIDGIESSSKEFTFRLTGNGDDKVVTLKQGEKASFPAIKYTLEQVKAAGGKYTASYTVSEDPSNYDGYTNDEITSHTIDVEVTLVNGKLDIKRKVDDETTFTTANAPVSFTYTNKYAAKGDLKVEGDKILTGRDLDKNEFTFVLKGPKLPEEGITATNAKAANGQKGHFTFEVKDLYDQDDIGKKYTYTVSEVIPESDSDKLPNVTYDDEVYTVVAQIINNDNGTLTAKVTSKNSAGTTSDILFENDYQSSSDEVTFGATKSLTGRNISDNMFSFELEDVEGGKLKKAEKVQNTGASVIFKTTLTYNQNDVGKRFIYKISEVDKDKKSLYAYDDNVYYAKVDVSIVNGKVTAVRKYYKDRHCTEEIAEEKPVFINSYSSSDSVEISGTKLLEGFDNISDKGKYTFELYEGEIKADNKLDEFEVSGAGSFKFPSVEGKKYKDTDKKLFEYSEADLYDGEVYLPYKDFVYKVKEKDGGSVKNNVSYSNMVYTVTVRVQIDDTTDKITAKAHISPSVTDDILVFKNVYAATGELPLSGIKKIEGKAITNRAYTATLSKKVDGKYEVVATTLNDGPEFEFTAGTTTLKSGKNVAYLKYTQDDIGSEYEYQVTETLATDGSEIDDTVYTVVDTISKNDDGTLKIDRTITRPAVDKDGKQITEEVTEFEFNNKYTAEGKITLSGTKTMKNMALVEGDYTFVIKDSDGNVLERVDEDGNKIRYEVTNSSAALGNDRKAVSTFEFPELVYDQDALKFVSEDGQTVSYSDSADFYYTIEEVVPEDKADCIDYSNVIYNVKVTVADSKKNDGELIVTKVVTKKGYVASEDDDENMSLLDKLKSVFKKITKSDETADIDFVNTYTAKGFWDPAGNKVLTGRELENDAFQFRISEIDKLTGKVLKDEDGKELEAYVKNVGTTVTFNHENVSWLEYGIEDVGTHYYRVEEIEPGKDEKFAGDIYDDAVFEYVVEVVDNGSGTLEANTVRMDTIKDNKTQTVTSGNFQFSFNNKYEAEKKISFKGRKTMKGRLLGDDKYSFSLYESDKPLDNPTNVMKATNDADGLVQFGEITYRVDADHSADEVLGKHYYIISEDETSVPGVTKSPLIYRITVNVTDPDFSGELSAIVENVELVSKSASGYTFDAKEKNLECLFSFENTYEATANVSFFGTKHLKNIRGGVDVTSMTELDGKFGFKIVQYDDAERTKNETLVDTKRTDGKGNYTLSGINYTQDDLKDSEASTYAPYKDFYYRISEVVPAGAEEVEFEGQKYWFYNNVYYNTNGITEYDINVRISPTTPASNKLDVVVTDAKTGAVIASENSGNTYRIGGNGYFDFENIKPIYKEIRGKKTWNDKVTDPSSRPTVTIRLYSSEDDFSSVIDTREIVAPNYEYEFLKLPALDKSGREITYKVDEAELKGYLSEQFGYDFTNTSGELLIRKLSAETGMPLEGAVFTLLDSAGNEVDRWTSGTSAHVVDVTKVKLNATYTVHEVSAPDGYLLAPDKTFTFEAGTTNVVTIEDPIIKGSVRLRKLDADTREALAGAEFALYTADGDRVYASGSAGSYEYSKSSSNGRFMVGGSGELEITGLPYGSYYFTEIAAPSGYMLSSDRHTFSVLTDGEVAEVTVLNTKERGSVRLRKTNIEGSVSLAGAVFELYAKTPSSISAAVASTIYSDAYYRVGTYTTDASGMIYVGDLPWDDYYFVEVQAPAGYEVNTDVNGDPIAYTFTIGSTGTATVAYDLGRITNAIGTTPPPPPRRGEVRGARTPKVDDGRRAGGVLSGVLGVRAAPKSGVLGERLGPVTGDAANIFLWMLLLLASVGAIVAVMVANIKRRKQAK